MQNFRDLGLALLNSSLGSNPLVQQLSVGLLAVSNEWAKSLPKLVNDLDPSGYLSQLQQAFSPQGLAQQLTSKFADDPMQFIRGLGAKASDLTSLARLPEFVNGSTLRDLANQGVDLGQLATKFNPSEISATVQSLARQGLNGAQIGDTFKGLANGKTLENAVGSLKDLPKNIDASKLVDTVRSQLPDNITLAQGSVKIGGALFEAGGSVGKPGGPFYAEGHIAIGEASLALSGEVKASLKDLTLSAHGKVQAEINLIRAEGQVSTEFGVGSIHARGNAQVGATALGEGSVKLDPLKGDLAGQVNGEAFAGARAGGVIKPTLGPVGATGGVQVQAGIGVNFKAEAGFKDGKFSYQLDFGAALGIGIRYQLGFSVDFKKIASAIKDVVAGIAKGLGALASKLAGGIGAVGSAIKNGVRSAVSWVGKGLQSVGKGVANFAKNTFNFMGGAAKSVGKAAESAAKAVGGAVADAGKAVGGAAKSVGNAVGKVFSW